MNNVTQITLASMTEQERVDYASGLAVATQATQEANVRLANDRRTK